MNVLTTEDPAVIAEYTDLLMLQQRLQGKSYQEIALVNSISLKDTEARINAIASECMRGAMAATRGNPDHPQPGLFKVEDFSLDPRRCMEVIMENRIEAIESRYLKK